MAALAERQLHEFHGIQEATIRKPFAFDLASEYDWIQQYGDGYKQVFFENAWYYAKESYGKVPVVQYEHKVKIAPDGRARLTFGPGDGDAAESYRAPAYNPELPLWYRERAYSDAEFAEAMNTELLTASLDDVFIDLSPTEYDVTLDERKKWGFGTHSFIRAHQFVFENGKAKLVSKGMRNYLNEPEQYALLERLTGQAFSGGILGSVAKLTPGMTIGQIDAIAKELYDQTPEERKLKPLEDDTVYKSDQEMNTIFTSFERVLVGVYLLIQRRRPKSFIQKTFQIWEKAVQAATRGEEIDWEFFENFDPEALLEYESSSRFAYDSSPLGEYALRTYTPGTNGCGLGSGFGDMQRASLGNIVTYDGLMTYGNMTRAQSMDGVCLCVGLPHFHCPGSLKRKEEKGKEKTVPCEYKITIGLGITVCIKCGETKKC